LMESKKYGPKFKAFYLALARDKSVKTIPTQGPPGSPKRTVSGDETERVLLQHLGVKDVATLESEWHEHVRSLKATTAHGFADAPRLYEMLGLPIKARRFYETAIQKGDQRAGTWYGLGRVLQQKEQLDPAENAFKKAIEADPLNGMFHAAMAHVLEL